MKLKVFLNTYNILGEKKEKKVLTWYCFQIHQKLESNIQVPSKDPSKATQTTVISSYEIDLFTVDLILKLELLTQSTMIYFWIRVPVFNKFYSLIHWNCGNFAAFWAFGTFPNVYFVQ